MALFSGYLYDKIGTKLLAVPFALSVLPFVFQSLVGLPEAILASIAYDLVLGMQESTYRAAITDMVPLSRRGSAYGFFNVMLGAGTFVSGVAFGYMLDASVSPLLMLSFVVVAQVIAIFLLWTARHEEDEPAITVNNDGWLENGDIYNHINRIGRNIGLGVALNLERLSSG